MKASIIPTQFAGLLMLMSTSAAGNTLKAGSNLDPAKILGSEKDELSIIDDFLSLIDLRKGPVVKDSQYCAGQPNK